MKLSLFKLQACATLLLPPSKLPAGLGGYSARKDVF